MSAAFGHFGKFIEFAKLRWQSSYPTLQVVRKGIDLLRAILFLSFFYPIMAQAVERALVIGNDSYEQLPTLLKANEDAQGYAELFERRGFEVTLVLNAPMNQMRRQLAEFYESIQPGDSVVFVYSGHGWSDGSQNFLVPIDAERTDSIAIAREMSIPLKNGVNGILDNIAVQQAKLAVAVIDACRNNPFGDSLSRAAGVDRGLVPIEPAEGTFVVYSAGAGQKALDRLGEADSQQFSVFTRFFLRNLDELGDLRQATIETRNQVQQAASIIGKKQKPSYYDELTGTSCLFGSCGPTPVLETPEPQSSRAVLVWDVLQRTSNIAALTAFVERYQDSDPIYAELARLKMAELQGSNPLSDQMSAWVAAPVQAVEARPAPETAEIGETTPFLSLSDIGLGSAIGGRESFLYQIEHAFPDAVIVFNSQAGPEMLEAQVFLDNGPATIPSFVYRNADGGAYAQVRILSEQVETVDGLRVGTSAFQQDFDACYQSNDNSRGILEIRCSFRNSGHITYILTKSPSSTDSRIREIIWTPDYVPELQLAEVPNAIRQMQTSLSAAGCSPGVPDGLFGSMSLNALRSYNAAVSGQCEQLEEMYPIGSKTEPDRSFIRALARNNARLLACSVASPVCAWRAADTQTITHLDNTNETNGLVEIYTQVISIVNRREINAGLTNSSSSYLAGVFGPPRQNLTQDCQRITNPILKGLVVTRDVGPIRVTMLEPAILSLQEVFKNVQMYEPELYNRIGAVGSLCVRLDRGSQTSISTHAYGLSVDLSIDGQLDTLGDGKAQLGLTILAKFFKKEGWYWGADFGRENSMHFQVSREKIETWRRLGQIPSDN